MARRSAGTIVDAEIFKQTTEDGVDFEKSTAYHRLVLEAFLTSRPAARAARRAAVRRSGSPGSSACSSSSRRTPSPTAWRRSSAMPTMAACRSWARRRSTIIATCCRPAPCCSAAATSSARRPLLGRVVLAARARGAAIVSTPCAAADGAGRVEGVSRRRLLRAAQRPRARDRRLRRGRHARPRRPRPQRHPQLRDLARRHQPRHRLRRVPLHRVARVAEPVPQHGVPQRRAGRRRGAESVHLARPPVAAARRCAAGDVAWECGESRRLLPRRALRLSRASTRRCASPAKCCSSRTAPTCSFATRSRAAALTSWCGAFTSIPRVRAERSIGGDVRLSRRGPRGVAADRRSACRDRTMTIEDGWVSPSYGVRGQDTGRA